MSSKASTKTCRLVQHRVKEVLWKRHYVGGLVEVAEEVVLVDEDRYELSDSHHQEDHVLAVATCSSDFTKLSATITCRKSRTRRPRSAQRRI